MPVLEEGIYAFLVADVAIHAVVEDRIYEFRIPQKALVGGASYYPCITYQRISTPRIVTHDSSGATGDLTNPRFQFDAWGVTGKSVKAIADVLRSVLHGKTGAMGGVTIRAALADNEAPEIDPESELYRSRSDYFIWQEE